MKKRVQKYGGSLIIRFNKDEVAEYGIVEGDKIDIEDMLIQKRRKKK